MFSHRITNLQRFALSLYRFHRPPTSTNFSLSIAASTLTFRAQNLGWTQQCRPAYERVPPSGSPICNREVNKPHSCEWTRGGGSGNLLKFVKNSRTGVKRVQHISLVRVHFPVRNIQPPYFVRSATKLFKLHVFHHMSSVIHENFRRMDIFAGKNM